MTIGLSTLANGLRIATDRIDTVDTVSLGLWVDVGTRHEPAEVNGVAHFLEHMAFKGTERRSAQVIAEEIEAVGGQLNAYTSRESTAYYAKVLKEDLLLAVDMLADLPAKRAVETEVARYTGGDRREPRDLEQLHLVLGFPGPSLAEPDFYTASVLSTALGGGMSSRLFQEIREKRGLVYAIHSFVHGYRDSGLFGIYAGTGESEAAELVPVLCGEIVRLADGLGAVELNRAKAQMKAGLLMSLESTSARCEQLAQHLLIHGTPFDPAEAVRRIEAVDAAAIGHVVARWRTALPPLAALGPLNRLEAFDRVAARLAA